MSLVSKFNSASPTIGAGKDGDDVLLREKDVAARLRLSHRTLQRYRRLGIGPLWTKIGKSARAPVRYRKSDVDAFLERRFGSTSEYTGRDAEAPLSEQLSSKPE